MGKLIKKEFGLAMHPTVAIMIVLSFIVVIPNYPYAIAFFYMTLAIYFTCLNGRENNDIVYTLMLPIAKRDVVKARFLMCIILEMIQLAVLIPLSIVSATINPDGNAAGMDANPALFGLGLVMYGVFNLIFFTMYYKKVTKPGVPFFVAAILMFVIMFAEIVISITVPVYANVIDTPGMSNLSYKLIYLIVGIMIYVIFTMVAYKISVKRFLKQDL